MKIFIKFFIAIIFMELGFFLFFSGNIAFSANEKDLVNYPNGGFPEKGSECEAHIIDIGVMFYEGSDLFSKGSDDDRYYIAQLNDGRFMMLKSEADSDRDIEINNFMDRCNRYFNKNKGDRPSALFLEGIIGEAPKSDDVPFEDSLNRGAEEMMRLRGFARLDIADLILDVREYGEAATAKGALRDSLSVVTTAANALKRALGIIATIFGIRLIILGIQATLNELAPHGGNIREHMVAGGRDVFGNIDKVVTDWSTIPVENGEYVYDHGGFMFEFTEDISETRQLTYDDMPEHMKKSDFKLKK